MFIKLSSDTTVSATVYWTSYKKITGDGARSMTCHDPKDDSGALVVRQPRTVDPEEIILTAYATRLALSPREQKFVEVYLLTEAGGKGGNASEACRQAGYSPNAVNRTASRKLREPKVREAIRAGRTYTALLAGYTLEAAMREQYEAYEIARDNGNGLAMSRAGEIRAKLAGFLNDRVPPTPLVVIRDYTGRSSDRDSADVDSRAQEYSSVVDRGHDAAEQLDPLGERDVAAAPAVLRRRSHPSRQQFADLDYPTLSD